MTHTHSRRCGIVLFAHGSRDPLWRQPIQAVAARIAELDSAIPVQCAYLELCTPDLTDAVATLTQHDVTHITVLPLFLGVGKHAREDLPLLMAQLRLRHPQVTFDLRPAISEDARLIHLLAQMALQT